MTGFETACAACQGEDPQAAWRHYARVLERTVDLVDEPHFLVSLRRCPACRQCYVWIFTESIDWVGGEDAQHRIVVPITDDEAADLMARGRDLEPAALEALGDDRRYLVVDWPTGAPDRCIAWSSGRFSVVPGD